MLGGSDAADCAGLPVGTSDDDLDVYLRASNFEELTNTHVVRFGATKPNLHLIVAAGAWPFTIEAVLFLATLAQAEGDHDSARRLLTGMGIGRQPATGRYAAHLADLPGVEDPRTPLAPSAGPRRR